MTSSVHASGTYPPVAPARPPSRPGEQVAIDERTFEAGKRIFTGRAPLDAPSAEKAYTQRPLLELWQLRLPWPNNRFAKLPALAGRLTDEQMQNLEYYVAVRFRIKTR